MKPIQIINKIIISLFFVFLSAHSVFGAEEDISVNFFYGITCPHCKIVEPLIEELKQKYTDIEFNQYEVYKNKVNSSRLNSWYEGFNVPANQRGVPVVFLDGTYLVGDTPIINNLENEIIKLIKEKDEEVSVVGTTTVDNEETVSFDPLVEPEDSESSDLEISPDEGQVENQAEDLAEDQIDNSIPEPDVETEKPVIESLDEEIVEDGMQVWQDWHWWMVALISFIVFYGIYKFWTAKSMCFCLSDRQKDYITVGLAVVILVGFFILAKNISPEFLEQIGYTLPLPIFTFLIALVDGFNPCNLFVLTFLLALLTSASHSKVRIYAIGFTFVIMVFVIYFLFMAAWLNIFKYIGFITPLRIAIAMIALIAGVINCKELLFFRKGITLMVQDRHKGPLVQRIEHMKELIEKGTMPVLISSSIALAAFASMVELPCTAGFPIIYTGILSAKLLEGMIYYGYLALYNLFYVLPLAVVIIIFGFTFQGKKISQRQMQIIKFIGGMIMILLGIILLVNPGMIGIAG